MLSNCALIPLMLCVSRLLDATRFSSDSSSVVRGHAVSLLSKLVHLLQNHTDNVPYASELWLLKKLINLHWTVCYHLLDLFDERFFLLVPRTLDSVIALPEGYRVKLCKGTDVICDLLEFAGVSEKTLSLACGGINVSAFQKQSYIYERLTCAVAQMMTFGTNEELCRVSQFVDHLIQQCDVCEILSPTAKLGDQFAHMILTDAVILHNATSDCSSRRVYCSYTAVIKAELERTKSRTSSYDTRVKTLCSLYGCALRAAAVANCDSAVDCITVLLLDILSAVQDAAQDESAADSHLAWCGVVQQLTDAKSEAAERCGSRDLAAVTRKLVQMRDSL